MSNQVVEADDTFEVTKSHSLKAVKEYLTETFAMSKEDFEQEVADTLEIEVEELPKVNLSIVATIGGKTVTVSGFEAEEKEEDDTDDGPDW